MTITWFPPYSAPQNLQAVLQPGGSLEPNTTYYVRVYGTDDGGTRQGIISAEISFTTTDTECSALLTWDPVPDAPYYGVVYRKASQDYNRYGAFLREPSTNNLYYTTTGPSFLFQDTSPYYYTIHPFVIPEPPPMGLNWENGRGYVEVDDGTVTPEDIDAAIGDPTYSIIDGATWYLQGSVKVTSETAELLVEDLDVWWAGMPYVSAGGRIAFGKKDETTYFTSGRVLTFVPHISMRPTFTSAAGALEFHGCVVRAVDRWGHDTAGALYPWLDYGGVLINRSMFFSQDWTYSARSKTCSIRDTYFQKQFQVPVTGDYSGVVDNSFGGLDLIGNADVTIHRNRLHSAYSWSNGFPLHVRLSAFYGRTKRLRDIVLDEAIQTPLGRNVLTASWYHSPSDPETCDVLVHETTVTVTVIDEAGAPLEGATITVMRGDDTVAVSGVTGQDGVWSAPVERGRTYWDPTATATSSNAFEDYGPFSVRIEREGFQVIEILVDLSDPPLELSVPMLRVVPPVWIGGAVGVDVETRQVAVDVQTTDIEVEVRQ